jgi:hypothetical protein
LKNLHLTDSTEESMAINRIDSGAIIIAGSGMANGGRVRHHLRHRLPFDRNHVVFVGYQARGTLGRKLVDGAEFVGRFATITALHPLGEGELCAILTQGLAATPLARARSFAHIHGIELDWTDDACAELARRAAALGTGARGLQQMVQATLAPVHARWAELADEGVSRVVITGACAAGEDAPQYERGERRRHRSDERLRAEYRGRRTPAPQCARTALDAFLVGAAPKGPYTDTTGWTDADLWRAIERTLSTHLDWNVVTTPTQLSWRRFELQHRKRPLDVLRVIEELRNRKIPLGDFCLAAAAAGTDSLPAILHYLDYRLERMRYDAERPQRGGRDDDDGGDEDRDP